MANKAVSEFYCACCNGDLTNVKALLTSMSTTEIDCMEPNGSTALHAASYFSHIDIVRLLLEKGASPDQKNKYGKMPEEEAKNSEIAQLFHDIEAKPDVDWAISNIFDATSQHRRFYSFNQGPPTLSYVVDKLLNAKELFGIELKEYDEMNRVKTIFQNAIESNDATQLIFVYTLAAPFYSILNKTLACHNELTNEERENPSWFCTYARFLASDEPRLRPCRWTGIAYRGATIP